MGSVDAQTPTRVISARVDEPLARRVEAAALEEESTVSEWLAAAARQKVLRQLTDQDQREERRE